MKIMLLCMILALAACDSEVSRTYHEDQLFTRNSNESCSKGAGYCCAYGLGFDGKMQYSCDMKHSCPGSRPVFQEVVPYTATLESGKIIHRESVRSSIPTGTCQ